MLRGTKSTLAVLVSVAIGFCADRAVAQEVDSVELAFTGDFLGSRVFPESGQGWFAVRQTPAGITLSETRIEVSQAPNVCAGTATRIMALDVSEPMFLVRGLSSFRTGSLDSVLEERRFVYPAEGFSVRLDSGNSFGFQAYGSAAPAVGGVRVTDYAIRMYQGTRTQPLAALA